MSVLDELRSYHDWLLEHGPDHWCLAWFMRAGDDPSPRLDTMRTAIVNGDPWTACAIGHAALADVDAHHIFRHHGIAYGGMWDRFAVDDWNMAEALEVRRQEMPERSAQFWTVVEFVARRIKQLEP